LLILIILHAGERLAIDPQSFYPFAVLSTGVSSTRHTWSAVGHRASITKPEMLPDAERKLCKLIESDKDIFCPVIVVDVGESFAISKSEYGTIRKTVESRCLVERFTSSKAPPPCRRVGYLPQYMLLEVVD
jgi:hypothetical protein